MSKADQINELRENYDRKRGMLIDRHDFTPEQKAKMCDGLFTSYCRKLYELTTPQKNEVEKNG